MVNRNFYEVLICENGNFIFSGNLTVEKEIILQNSNLIISSTLTIDEDCKATINNSNISVCNLKSYVDIKMKGRGDIFVAKHLDAKDIETEGDILVQGNTDVFDVKAKNYQVQGENDSYNIIAQDSIIILGENNSYDIKANYVKFGSQSDLNYYKLVAKRLECCKKIVNIKSLSVG